MLIENEFEVAAPLEQVWRHMQDVPRIAPCLPGAELTDVNGDVYKGRVTTKMGPVKLQSPVRLRSCRATKMPSEL
jgi:carbon monoxide dehydrogenase subunit G